MYRGFSNIPTLIYFIRQHPCSTPFPCTTLFRSVSQTDLLNSWKEIAAYLNRGVRTVQRWEVELGLPVRRPRAKNRSAVIAMRSEIDEWLKACPVTEREKTNGAEIRVAVPPKLPLTTLLVKSNELHHTVSA